MNNKKDDGMPLPTAGNHRDASHAGSAPNPAVAVGAQLASARTEKGRSVDEMASRLKVSAAKVVALEAGDLAPLHDAAFAVGLVRSYAKVLGMDPEPLTDAMRGVRHTHAPNLALPPSGAKASSSMRRANVPLSWSTRRSDRRSWIWGGLAAVIVLVLLVVWRVGNEPNGWLQRVKGEAASDVDAANPQAVSGAVVSTLPPVGANGMSAETSSGASSTPSSSSAPQGGSEAVVAALNAPTQSLAAAGADAGSAAASLATLAAVSSAHPGAASAPLAPGVGLGAQAASGSAAPAPGTSRLSVNVTQNTWMSVKGADGRTAFSGIVHAGQSQQIDAVRPMRVTVGNMTGVSGIEQDGHAVDLKTYAGNGKNVARFTLP